MHPLTSSPAPRVSFDSDGGIRNLACQDAADCLDNSSEKPQRERARIVSAQEEPPRIGIASIREKSQKLKDEMTICRTSVPWKCTANIIIFIIVGVVVALGELSLFPNQKLGFYCNDPKNSFKFQGDTVTFWILLLVTVLVPLLVMWSVERSVGDPDNSYNDIKSATSSRTKLLIEWFGNYILGSIYLLFVVEIVKVIVGEPRPHFFDSCRPKENFDCNDPLKYIFNYECDNEEYSWLVVLDSDKSFPSGHSAMSMFTATFLIWYLQVRLPERLTLILVKPWLQCLAMIWGLCCGMSRITDHRHHWWDVLAGGTLGTLFAIFTVMVSCKRFRTEMAEGDPESTASNGPQLAFDKGSKRHQSVRKLLSNSNSTGEIAAEGRELGDVATTWIA